MAQRINLPKVVGVTALLLAAAVFGARAWPADGTKDAPCVTVYHAQSKGDDPVADLCVTVEASGTRVDRVTITLTAQRSACDDAVGLHVSASSPSGEISDSRKVDCVGDRARAAFDIGQQLDSGVEVCGSLPDDAPYHRFRPARTCVRL
ncbi:hypothetical protein [Phytohabitans rumicis]|uniref:Secreted protein n=1 Tax=Phytohabitans rumicis TaxID=1076125 RepID=A0A6V8KU47_9ACTN|nr:hypothetical protein [Phytohabitans rumicis]GFJ87354.1 hypothetical protein Prum_009960 [Phytohabitans rumicis]